MSWSPLMWTALGAAGLATLALVQLIHLSAVLTWEDRKTQALGYYGLPPAERGRFRRALRRHARLLFPIIRVSSRLSKFSFARISFRHRGIAAPRGTCSAASFERAEAYRVGPHDVVVATPMKCGTTWMLHLVYQLLRRGEGDLVESGSTLHAVCPWLEGRRTVPVEQAPLVGADRPSRVIKTHLPASHCPWSPEARYLYVVRHPVSCFASCTDFIAENLGRFAPPLPAIEEWFCSDELMWWGTWPAHVRGWWDLSRQRANVLFVSFEEMKRDLAGVVRQVAGLLGVEPLTGAELDRVLHKCSFRYMQEHKGTFEMHPPHLLAVEAELFVRGTADRDQDVAEATRRRILAWCAAQMKGSDFPLDRFYPEVAAAGSRKESGAESSS